MEIQNGGEETYVTLSRVFWEVLLENWYWTKAAKEP